MAHAPGMYYSSQRAIQTSSLLVVATWSWIYIQYRSYGFIPRGRIPRETLGLFLWQSTPQIKARKELVKYLRKSMQVNSETAQYYLPKFRKDKHIGTQVLISPEKYQDLLIT